MWIYTYGYISIHTFQLKMYFSLGKNYTPGVCWTLGVTRLKQKLTLKKLVTVLK